MVSEEAYTALQAENARLRAENAQQQEQMTALSAQLAAAVQRTAALEAQKTPPSFVKANVPARPAKARRQRAPEQNQARRRETPTEIVEHDITTHCPDCGSALGGVHVGRTRQVIESPPPPPVAVAVIEHQVRRGRCGGAGAAPAGAGARRSWT